MDLSRPARCIAPALHLDVLVVLAGTTMPLTGRQVHRLISGEASQSGVAKVLGQLVGAGLVDVTDAGSANLYALNRGHVAADAVLSFTGLRGKLFDRIRDALESWPTPPLAAAVFGSAARGDGDEDSDIDLFLLRPPSVAADDVTWSSAVAQLNADIRRWSGNSGSVIDATPQQVEEMIQRDEPVVAELRRDLVPLLGVSVLDVAAVSQPRRTITG